jgi:hypothetical protein
MIVVGLGSRFTRTMQRVGGIELILGFPHRAKPVVVFVFGAPRSTCLCRNSKLLISPIIIAQFRKENRRFLRGVRHPKSRHQSPISRVDAPVECRRIRLPLRVPRGARRVSAQAQKRDRESPPSVETSRVGADFPAQCRPWLVAKTALSLPPRLLQSVCARPDDCDPRCRLYGLSCNDCGSGPSSPLQ